MAVSFPDWDSYQSVLCVRPDNMGDVLMTVPAIRALKQSVPDRKITLLTSSVGAAIARLIPEIDDVIVFDVPWVKNDAAHDPASIFTVVGQLKGRFDAAVIFTVYSQNPLPAAMLCYLAEIPHVLGYCRENPYQLINCWVPDTEPLEEIRHEVDRQLDLVATIGAQTEDKKLSLQLTVEEREAVREKLAQHIDLQRPWLILHAGVSEDKRLYPADKYTEAMRELVQRGYQIVLTGSLSEHDYVETLREGIGDGAYNLAGAFSITELCAAIAEAPLLVSNNTGPVHIAAAVGTPVVVLYAMTNPQHTPWMVPSRVLYFPVPEDLKSKNRFLQTFPGNAEPQASPEGIVQAVDELIGEGK